MIVVVIIVVIVMMLVMVIVIVVIATIVLLLLVMIMIAIHSIFTLIIVRPRIVESTFRNYCAKKLDGALRKPTSFV